MATKAATLEGAEEKLACPRCKGTNITTLKHQGNTFLLCGGCKYWDTKATPDNPEGGGFNRVKVCPTCQGHAKIAKEKPVNGN